MKKMTVQEVIEYLNNDETNDDFAFRGDDFVPAVGGYKNSWYHGDDAEFELDGVSAIGINSYGDNDIIKAMGRARMYGDNVVLLRGYAINAHEWAHDPGECLIQNSKIICIVDAAFEKTGDLDWNKWRIANVAK